MYLPTSDLDNFSLPTEVDTHLLKDFNNHRSADGYCFYEYTQVDVKRHGNTSIMIEVICTKLITRPVL